MSSTLQKRISLDAQSPTLRLYLWLYNANPRKINTCKLAWGLFFSPLVLIIRVLFTPVARLLDYLAKRYPSKPRTYKPRVHEDSFAERQLTNVSTKLTSAYARFQTAIRIIAIVLGLALAIFVVGGLVWLLVVHTIKTLIVLAWVLGTIIVVASVLAAGYFFSEGKGQEFTILVKQLGHDFHNHTCAQVEVKNAPSEYSTSTVNR